MVTDFLLINSHFYQLIVKTNSKAENRLLILLEIKSESQNQTNK